MYFRVSGCKKTSLMRKWTTLSLSLSLSLSLTLHRERSKHLTRLLELRSSLGCVYHRWHWTCCRTQHLEHTLNASFHCVDFWRQQDFDWREKCFIGLDSETRYCFQCVSVCACVPVNEPEIGSCGGSGSKYFGRFLYVCHAESAKSR